NSANYIFTCLSKTCLFEFNLKSNLPTDKLLKGRSILTVRR
ncbi:AAEL017413-PA, partial [Aedes aegypti]